MKKWYAYIILLASVLFDSCNIEDTLFPDQECDTKTEPVNVRLILSMMGGEGMSRALTDTPTREAHPEAEPSLGNEYYINPYDVEVLVFTCDATPEKSKFVERASMVRASETNDYYQYQLDGTLTKIQEGTPYRMVVLANMNGSCYTTGAIPLEEGTTTMKEYLHSLAYTGYTANFTNSLLTSDTERIPMWGTTAAYLNDGAQINMDLLRAMAKVKVKMAKSLGNLSAVTLEFANPGGYVTPLIANVNVDETTATNAIGVSAITNNDAVTKTITGGNTQRVRTPRIPTGLTPIKGLAAEPTLSFSDVSSTDNYEYVIYIPEYKNLDNNDTPARMKLAIGDKSYKLEFKDYSENNTGYFDIIRNYYYQFTITGVNDGYNLLLTCEVQPWDVEEIAIDYTDIATYTPLGWQEDTYDEQYSNEQNIYLTKGTTAIYKFKLESPQTAQIYASLTNSEDFEIGTQIVDSEIKDTTTGTTSIIKEVTISISAKDETDGIIGRYNETSLRVFAIMDNQESVELDMTGNSKTSTQQGVQVARYKIIQNY